jgi:hypothetical protein
MRRTVLEVTPDTTSVFVLPGGITRGLVNVNVFVKVMDIGDPVAFFNVQKMPASEIGVADGSVALLNPEFVKWKYVLALEEANVTVVPLTSLTGIRPYNNVRMLTGFAELALMSKLPTGADVPMPTLPPLGRNVIFALEFTTTLLQVSVVIVPRLDRTPENCVAT